MMERKRKGFCPICGGTGIDRAKTILHEETHHETALFYCNCWYGWLLEQRNNSTMKVKVLPLIDIGSPWGIQENTGNFGRNDGGFFEDIGIEATVPGGPSGREVTKWRQPMIRESGPGVIALFINERNDKILVTARAEPGNSEEFGYLLLGPSVQASKGNLDLKHKGKRPPYAELLDKMDLQWIEATQDGGRNYKKVNYYTLPVVKEKDIHILPNARWFSIKEIAQATENGDVNEHLSQAMWILTSMNMLR